jgi:hypothetical protein
MPHEVRPQRSRLRLTMGCRQKEAPARGTNRGQGLDVSSAELLNGQASEPKPWAKRRFQKESPGLPPRERRDRPIAGRDAVTSDVPAWAAWKSFHTFCNGAVSFDIQTQASGTAKSPTSSRTGRASCNNSAVFIGGKDDSRHTSTRQLPGRSLNNIFQGLSELFTFVQRGYRLGLSSSAVCSRSICRCLLSRTLRN